MAHPPPHRLTRGSEVYRNSDGSVRSNLAPRVKAAVLAAMLDSQNREVVERLLDNPEGFNALIGGLMQSAANLAELSNKPEYDISEELSQAVELFVEMRDKGMSLADFSAQGDFFRAAPSDEVLFLMGLFEENLKTPSGISGVLKQYARECKKIDTTTMDMFGTENPSKLEKLEEARTHYATDVAQQDANADVRGKYDEAPSKAEVREAERQKAEVKAKWTNPDGTPKKGYLCAPNGEPSRLTEDQWLQVRTPNFKRWFGDWETLAVINEIEGMPSAMDIPLADYDGKYIEEVYKSIKDAKLPDGTPVDFVGNAFGKLIFDKRRKLTYSVIPHFKELLEKSVLAYSEPERNPIKHKNMIGFKNYVSKINVDGISYYVRFTIQVAKPNKHESHGVFVSNVDVSNAETKKANSAENLTDFLSGDNSQTISPLIDDKLAKFLNSVNKKDVSRVVDENGEPLVVYHGTESNFNVFKHGKAYGSGDAFGYLGEAFYATNDEDVAQTYGDRVIPLFLNLKNPYLIDDPAATSPWSAGSFAKSLNVATEKVSNLLKSQGYDGVIAKDEDSDYVEYAVYESNQIKSATDNVGTFSENPDIRWSFVGENGMRNLKNLGRQSTGNLELAKEMLARGETPSNIWRKTGWFKNPKDGKWRYELDDGEIINAPFKENSNQLLQDVLDDAELYSAYPNLKNRWVAFRNIANGGAYFDGKNFYVDNSFADNPKGLKELLIHEIQHSIQIDEGFVRGANEGMFTSENSKLLNWKIEEVSREYDDLQAERKRVSKESGLSDKIREIADDDDFVEKYEKLLEESGVKDVLAELDDKIFEKGDELLKLQEERNNEETGLLPHEKYMRVAGEVEARNAAARQRQLSPDMRRKLSPEATQDIPFDEQILGRNDGVNPDIRWSFRDEAELDALDKRHRELYEAYKNGDRKAFAEAAKLVADYAQGKGYGTKVYHGTGADGFNVAKADASEAQNGEGAQAHGMGLYMAEDREVAEEYWRQAGGGYFSHYEVNGVDLDNTILPPSAKAALISAKKQNADIEELIEKNKDDPYRLATYRQVKAFLDAEHATVDDVKRIEEENGKVFDWFTNLKPGEVIDENKPLSEQPEIWEKFKNAWIDMWAYVKRKRKGKRYWESLNPDRLGKDGYRTAGFIFSRWSDEYGSAETINLLLRNGIYGITYDGHIDGRCYVSFEGGGAVKLQDPFTFDDNGGLIPLSKRFDEGKPDMRWSFEDGENVDRILSLTPERALELLNGSIAGFEKRYDEAREKWKASRKDNGWVYDEDVEGYVRKIEFENGTVEGFKASEDADETYSAFVDDDYKEFSDEFDAADALWESYKRENEITETDDHITAFEAFCEMFRELLGDEDGFFDEGYSNKSESRYVEFGGYDKKGVKIRFSDHNLPPFYKQPDFNVWGVESLRKRLPEIIEAVKAGAEQSERDRLADEDADGELRWSFHEKTPNLFEKLKDIQGESAVAEKLEENGDLKYYFDYFKKNLLGRKIQTPIGKFAYFTLGHFNKLIAKGENKGESGEVSSLKEWIDKIEHNGVDLEKNPPKGFDYSRACNMPLVVDVLQNPQFVLVDTDDTLLFVKKYGEKTYLWCSVMNNGETLGIKSWRPLRLTRAKCEQLKVVYPKENGVVNLAQPRESQRNSNSANFSENQEKNSRLRFLLRQERSENPVIWASIVLAKEIYLGRAITASKLETVLPSSKFDGTKREYALARAKEIADRYRINKEKFGEKLDLGLQRAENDLYWRRDVMDEMYASFRADGEEYGYIKARLKEWLKNERRRDLEKIKGLSSAEIGIDVAGEIENAIDAEPERPKPSEKKPDETEDEDLDDAETSGREDAEVSDKPQEDGRFDTRGIIAKIRQAATKAAKKKDFDEYARRRLYRNTLADSLRQAAQKLCYGRERERILAKITELAGKAYVAVKIKDGDRAGQIVDNYTLRAERIASRIFNRGVRDDKQAMTEKLDAILERRGKKPSRMQRDDKRSMTGLVQQRIHNISRYVEMDAEAVEEARREAIAKLEDVDKNFVQDAENGKIREDVEDVRAELENVLHDLEMFGGWADKSRAEMANALEFLEKTIETETAAQRERVEKRKARNAAVRKIIADALKMSPRNAARDGGVRVALRKTLNASLPFDSFLGILGEHATGETRRVFEEWRKDLIARIDRAANAKANEVFQEQQKFIELVEKSYSGNFNDALKRLLEPKGEYERFSVEVNGMRQPMCLANVIQLYVSAAQQNYEFGVVSVKKRVSVRKPFF